MAEVLAESDREYGKTQSLLLFVDTWMFHKLCSGLIFCTYKLIYYRAQVKQLLTFDIGCHDIYQPKK